MLAERPTLRPRRSRGHPALAPDAQVADSPLSLSFRSPLRRSDRVLYLALVGLWLAANAWFWLWWGERSHFTTVAGFVLNTLVIAADILEPGWFLYFAWRLRHPVVRGYPRPWPRVAAVTTKTPGEPLSIVGQTLVALKSLAGPHDTWLLDEGDDPATRAFCAANGIRHFSRKGVERYQQSRWPFQARMKAGNYNSWLDAVGYASYDVISQFDSDHRPNSDYLERTVPILQADPKVAYVAAPSICTGNREESWTVLGRAELEATFHGPLQAGFNGGWAPLIIGSHCVFRIAALRSLGGFQTTWCEDHDNTLALNASGYEGVFQPAAIAVGDGPNSFAQAIQQEYQWARGLMQILLTSTPRWIGGLSWRKRIAFIFGQTWYPRFSLIRLGGVLLPALALATSTPVVNVDYLDFVWRQALVALPLVGVVWLLWARGETRPNNILFVSWRTPLFQMARWPWILLACGEAVLGKALGRDFAIKVTAKGTNGQRPLPFGVLWPYVLIVAFSLVVAARFGASPAAPQGYAVLALLNAGWYAALLGVVAWLHLRENAPVAGWFGALRATGRAVGVAGAALAFSIAVTVGHFAPWELTTPAALAADAPPTVVAGVSMDRVTESASPLKRPSIDRAAFPAGRVAVGAYDPTGALAGQPLDGELIFNFWQRDDASALDRDLDRAVAAGRTPIVTIEPYAWETDGFARSSLLADIAAGRYDSTIRAYAVAIADRRPTEVPVRFAHEMDLAGVHVWSTGDAPAYVAAYRHFVDVFRASGAANVVWVWSPAGTNEADRYYPGDAYVDLVGVTVLASEQWDRAAGFTGVRSFRELLTEKAWLADLHDKPLVVAEVAVSTGDPESARRWLAEARQSIIGFPRLRGFVYFNAPQPANTPFISSFPDWRLTEPADLIAVSGLRQAR